MSDADNFVAAAPLDPPAGNSPDPYVTETNARTEAERQSHAAYRARWDALEQEDQTRERYFDSLHPDSSCLTGAALAARLVDFVRWCEATDRIGWLSEALTSPPADYDEQTWRFVGRLVARIRGADAEGVVRDVGALTGSTWGFRAAVGEVVRRVCLRVSLEHEAKAVAEDKPAGNLAHSYHSWRRQQAECREAERQRKEGELRRSEARRQEANPPDKDAVVAGTNPKGKCRPKRSTQKGEARVKDIPADQEASTSDKASLALLRVFTNGLADDRIKEANRVLSDDNLTAHEKLTKIDALIPFPPTASAEQLGDILGVTKQAVLKTDWWKQNRKGEKANEIGRRRTKHQKRAKEYEPSPAPDDDDER